MGVPVVECPEAVDSIVKDETVRIDLDRGELDYREGRFKFPLLADFALEIIRDGGLIPHTKKLLKQMWHRYRSENDKSRIQF